MKKYLSHWWILINIVLVYNIYDLLFLISQLYPLKCILPNIFLYISYMIVKTIYFKVFNFK